jgi:hypothetical protein
MMMPLPSKTKTDYWLHATNPSSPHNWTDRSRKWLIFVPPQQIDEKWLLISKETASGTLGISAKAATAKSNLLAKGNSAKLICV